MAASSAAAAASAGVVPEAVKSHRELSEHPDAQLAVGLLGSLGKQLRRPGDRPRRVLEHPDRRQHAAPHGWLGIRGEHVLGEVAGPRDVASHRRVLDRRRQTPGALCWIDGEVGGALQRR